MAQQVNPDGFLSYARNQMALDSFLGHQAYRSNERGQGIPEVNSRLGASLNRAQNSTTESQTEGIARLRGDLDTPLACLKPI